MASYAGVAPFAGYPGLRAEISGRAAAAYAGATQPVPATKLKVNDPAVLAAPLVGGATDAHQEPGATGVGYLGVEGMSSTPGLDFYERFHVIPRSLVLGNILSTTTVGMEVFSAFRDDAEFWTAFDNNAGAGVSLIGAPTLPVLVQPMAGFLFSVQIELAGPAIVDSTLDFTFNVTGVIQIPISFQRVVALAFPPEMPVEESLEWLTDVMESVDRTEQRVSLRLNPRQRMAYEFFVEDGVERSVFENKLFDWQGRTFGLPFWPEATPLAAAVVGGTTTVITVTSTADADFRDGGLVILWESQTKFDVLNLVSHTATTLTVLNAPASSYTPLADFVLVAPLRLGVAEGAVGGSRYAFGQDRFKAKFRVKDNDSSLADVSTFSALLGKVLLDDANLLESGSPMDESYDTEIVTVDGRTGVTFEYVREPRHRRASVKRFAIGTKAALWRVRKLLHALRGRQLSFYLPTFCKDLVPIGTMTSGQFTLAVSNVGYTNLVRTRQPKNIIRVVPVTGAAFIRTITGSTAPTAVQENITVDVAWPSTLTPAQIASIQFVEKSRLDSDVIRIRHEPGSARRIACPVKTVLE